MKQSFFDGTYHGYAVRVMLVRENLKRYTPFKITHSEDVYDFLRQMTACDRERFITILLDNKNQVIGVEETSVGSLSGSLVHPREVLKTAILSSAASIIIAHNHPSGNPEPSLEDRELTRRLKSACEILGIQLLDHIIIGVNNYQSFADRHLL